VKIVSSRALFAEVFARLDLELLVGIPRARPQPTGQVVDGLQRGAHAPHDAVVNPLLQHLQVGHRGLGHEEAVQRLGLRVAEDGRCTGCERSTAQRRPRRRRTPPS
jgi:hypothetical protein